MSNVKQIVKDLNDKLFWSTLHDQDYFWYLKYTETPIGDIIEYYGQILWDSENDYRLDDKNTEDGREDIKTYLIKEIGNLANILQKSHKILK